MTEPMSLGNGLLVTLIGISIVFLGLVILISLIKILVILTSRTKKPKKSRTAEVAPAAAPAPAPVAEEPEQDDGELVAVITAAIAMMTGSTSGFVVRRVRRLPR